MSQSLTIHRIRASLAAAGIFNREWISKEVARTSYLKIASNGVFTQRDFIAGELLLLESGLLERQDELLRSSSVLLKILLLPRHEATIALAAHILRHRSAEATGEFSFVDTFSAMGMDPLLREAILLAAGVRVDSNLLRKIGDAGEECVVEASRNILISLGLKEMAIQVKRVSLISDQLGYDVVAPLPSGAQRMEVKTTTSLSPTVTLTRAEYEWGKQDSAWYLVLCHYDIATDRAEVIGWCRTADLPAMPVDKQANWASVTFSLPVESLTEGLPLG